MTYTQEELDSFRRLIKADLKRRNGRIFHECSFADEAVLVEAVLQTNLMNKTDFSDIADIMKENSIG